MKADICSGAFLLSLSSSSLWAMSMMIPLTDAVPAAAPLRFDENGRFQVAVFEDLHFGEGRSFLSIFYLYHQYPFGLTGWGFGHRFLEWLHSARRM